MIVDDKDLRKIFGAFRDEIPDDGFSKRVKERLLSRRSFLPKIVLGVCIFWGIALVFMIQDIDMIIYNVSEFVSLINQKHLPSVNSIVTYLSVLFCATIIGYALSTTD
jgi:hypothetical protein